MNMKGTPKDLRESIQNGIEETVKLIGGTTKPVPKAADVIERHVLDFLRQKFGVLYLKLDAAFEMEGKQVSEAVSRDVRELAQMIGVERRSG
jgi:hypothetical protein